MEKRLLFTVFAALVVFSSGVVHAGDGSETQIRPWVNRAGASMFVVWNTKSGTSRIYYWDSDASRYAAAELGLPANPMGKPAGNVMIEPYVNGAGASMFVVWDTKTGASKIFYWDSDASKYVAGEVGLPAAPLEKAEGPIMIKPYVNRAGGSMFVVWDTRTGTSKFFYWDSDASKYAAGELALPASPLK
jgi:hypothetical protein